MKSFDALLNPNKIGILNPTNVYYVKYVNECNLIAEKNALADLAGTWGDRFFAGVVGRAILSVPPISHTPSK